MRVILCDDDALVRSVVAPIVEERGHEVVGEADDELGALALLARVQPDLAIVDLALRISTGLEVVRAAWESGCEVVIFSSYLTPDLLRQEPERPVAVEKPHFDRLADALEQVGNSLAVRGSDRRARGRSARQPSPTFAQAVAEAGPGDAIVILEPPEEERALLEVVGLEGRRVTAKTDRVETTERQVRLLLTLAGAGGADAVVQRLAATAGVDLQGWSRRIAVVTEALSGAEAFDQIRRPAGDAATHP